MGQTVAIPDWVVPSNRQFIDCHRIATVTDTRVKAVMDWVARGATEDDVHGLLLDLPGIEQRTAAWLLGMDPRPPIELPRRNPDGSTLTEDQLYAEYIAGKTGLPEQKREARDRARRDAARYRQLATLAN